MTGQPREETGQPREETAGPDESRSLIRSSAVMAAGTAMSRVMGFARALLIAAVLGNQTRQAEMFTLANTLPTSLYILFAGGALNTVLVPQIVRATKHDADRGEAYTNRIMTAFLAIIGAVTLVLMLLAPVVLWIWSPDSWRTPDLDSQYQSMLTLTYLCLPQVFFYGAFFLAGQVLNARGRFGPMMWAPIANNLVSIAVFTLYLLLYGTGGSRSIAFSSGQEWLLGGGATLGIIVQAAILIPFLRRAGFIYRPRFDLRGVGLGHTFSLAKWTLGFVLVTQVAVVVVTRLAAAATTHADSGAGVTAYNNAYLVWILPHSLITVSLTTAMMTSASARAADHDYAGVARETLRTIRLSTSVLLPASVAFAVLGIPISQIFGLFGAGSSDFRGVGLTLIGFALGLVPFTIQYVCLRAFYALENTRITFWVQLVIAAANIGFALLLVLPLRAGSPGGHPELVAPALGLAYSLAYLVGCLLTFGLLGRRLPGLSGSDVLRHLVRVLVAVAPAALVAWLITWWAGRQGFGAVGSLAALAVAGVVAVALYLLVGRLMHISELTQIIDTVRRRGGGPPPPPTAPQRPVPASADLDTELDVTGQATRAQFSAFAEQSVADTVVSAPVDDAPPKDDRPTGQPVLPGETLVAESADEIDPELLAQHAGEVLSGRYRLAERLIGRGSTVTWRAFDTVLSRSVLVHLLPDTDRSAELLAAARASAVATDSRFLRVLDAVPATEQEPAHVVCEYAPGVSLEVLLSQGPLSALEAAWLVREVADAIAGVHALGLHHQRLNPDTVIITPAGNVKIVGFLIEAAIHPSGAERSVEEREATDVADIGRLLYATLVSRWPGAARYGLARAPHDGERLLTPRQVRHGVSPALDRITDAILSDPPRDHEEPLRTASAVAAALTAVLGTADASHDLERRVRQPVPVVGVTDDAPTEVLAAVESATSAPSAEEPSEILPHGVRVVGPEPGRRWLRILLLLVVLALVVGLISVFIRHQARSAGPAVDPSGSASASAPASAQVLPAAGVRVFDPQGTGANDPNDENNDQAARAIDGDPKTSWATQRYLGNPKFGGLKRGLGLIVDLGEVKQVTSVDVTVTGRTALQLRVPEQEGANPPMSSDGQWRQVAAATGSGTVALTPESDAAVRTRWVLVYLTSLPADSGGYRGRVAEVVVHGS